MFYNFRATIPGPTDKDSPVQQDLKLTRGVIHRVEVQFPIGTRALVHCRLLEGLHQVWPSNPDGDLASDGFVIAWDDFYELKAAPYTLRFEGWSTADTYSYDIDIRLGILAAELISPFTGVVGALRRFLKMVGVGG